MHAFRLLALAALIGTASAASAMEAVRDLVVSPGAGPLRVTIPAQAGPLPVVLILPNWYAVEDRIEAHAESLMEAGIASLALDVDTDARLTEARLAPILAAMLRAAEADPRFDARRIGILGFGLGARAALVQAQARPVAAITPGCAPLRHLPGGPVLALEAADMTRPDADCAAFGAALGPAARRDAYGGMTHAWDFVAAEWWERALWLPSRAGHMPEVDAQADAVRQVTRFMSAALQPREPMTAALR